MLRERDWRGGAERNVPLGKGVEMETEVIDKLYMELSQVTRATTAKELDWERRFNRLRMAVQPFADLVKTTDGRIPYERLSLANWHELVKAYDAYRGAGVAEEIRRCLWDVPE